MNEKRLCAYPFPARSTACEHRHDMPPASRHHRLSGMARPVAAVAVGCFNIDDMPWLKHTAMNNTEFISFPGSTASPDDIVALADEYRRAAVALIRAGRKGEPLSRAPGRLCAIHAIELYLNAFRLAGGTSPQEVRSHFHNLAARAERAIASGLALRKRTAEHLRKMTEDREYLVSRYAPEMTSTLSQLNRLLATLEEVARKTTKRTGIEQPSVAASPAEADS